MNNKKIMSILATLSLGLYLTTMSVAAADLAQAKSTGLVGEQLNGLLGLVKPDAPDDVKALVQSINSQRLAEYQRIAAKNGVATSIVCTKRARSTRGSRWRASTGLR